MLLSQAKGLSAAAQLRRNRAAAELVQRQLQWVVGRNPFVQSTMWGEGYDFAQQYSVSSGDRVGSLPVGIMTRGDGSLDLKLAPATEANGEVTIRLTATGSGRHVFTIRADNLAVDQPEKELVLRKGTPGSLLWKARMNSLDAPWVAVVIPDGDVGQRREAIGARPQRRRQIRPRRHALRRLVADRLPPLWHRTRGTASVPALVDSSASEPAAYPKHPATIRLG
ncbi:MAG: hypothetical protein AAB225_21745 [Acidobacteriota bacterium]